MVKTAVVNWFVVPKFGKATEVSKGESRIIELYYTALLLAAI